jgi:hypothetical protein
MDGDVGVDFQAEFDLSASNIEDRDFEHALIAVVRSDHDRFLTLPG